MIIETQYLLRNFSI